jgi:GTP cyclohydrolase FolE2
MTRKDYKAIAAILRNVYEIHGADNHLRVHQALKTVAEQYTTYAKQDNPRFARETFMEACGIN